MIHMKTRTIDPKQLSVKDLHQFILGSVAPRPIAFASTLDQEGRPNLAPYSFFNAFSSNPPVLVFSSNRKVKDNQTKDTLHNIRETGEVVINAVNFSMMRQMALASIEYPAHVDEFVKAGFTPLESDLVKPFRVAESPAQMECKVKDIITLGEEGGAGHLIICDVLRMHIHEDVIDEQDRIDPHRIDLVGRMGRAYYVRASGAAIHTVFQPVNAMAIGECTFGAGRTYPHTVFVTLGTGVGGALMINNQLYRGAHSMAGEIGHISIDKDGIKSPQGQGGLEQYVGNRRIVERALAELEKGRPSVLDEIVGGDRSKISPKEIKAGAVQGDELCLEILGFVCSCIATAFASITYMIQPQAFIVGGGVAQEADQLFDMLRAEVKNRLSPYFHERLEIKPAELGNSAGIIGCATMALIE